MASNLSTRDYVAAVIREGSAGWMGGVGLLAFRIRIWRSSLAISLPAIETSAAPVRIVE